MALALTGQHAMTLIVTLRMPMTPTLTMTPGCDPEPEPGMDVMHGSAAFGTGASHSSDIPFAWHVLRCYPGPPLTPPATPCVIIISLSPSPRIQCTLTSGSYT